MISEFNNYLKNIGIHPVIPRVIIHDTMILDLSSYDLRDTSIIIDVLPKFKFGLKVVIETDKMDELQRMWDGDIINEVDMSKNEEVVTRKKMDFVDNLVSMINNAEGVSHLLPDMCDCNLPVSVSKINSNPKKLVRADNNPNNASIKHKMENSIKELTSVGLKYGLSREQFQALKDLEIKLDKLKKSEKSKLSNRHIVSKRVVTIK